MPSTALHWAARGGLEQADQGVAKLVRNWESLSSSRNKIFRDIKVVTLKAQVFDKFN